MVVTQCAGEVLSSSMLIYLFHYLVDCASFLSWHMHDWTQFFLTFCLASKTQCRKGLDIKTIRQVLTWCF